MNLKILFVILLYYLVLGSVIYFAGSTLSGYTGGANLTSDTLTENESGYTGGIFSGGVSFTRFIGLLTFGVGLPSDTPDAARYLIMAWQSSFFVFSVAWFISSIWNG